MDIYIDSNVIVSAEIKTEDNHDKSKIFMGYVLENDSKKVTFYTSIFTFVELSSAMIRRTNNRDRAYSLTYRIRNSWKKAIKPLPPLPTKRRASFTALVDELIETSIQYFTSSADTIHAQTIATHDIDYLVTWNKKHFASLEQQIPNLTVLTPTEMLQELAK